MSRGQNLRALVRSVGDDGDANSFREQAFQRQLGHVAGAQYHCASAGQSAEDFLSQLYGSGADRRRPPTDAGLFTRARSGEQRVLEKTVDDRSRLRAAFFPRAFHLSLYLSFAKDHRIQACRHTEEMSGRITVVLDVDESSRVPAQSLR